MFSVFIAILILLSAFISFTPNIQQLIENDFLRQSRSNFYTHSLQRGQLAYRAKTIDTNAGTNSITLGSEIRSDPQTTINSTVTANLNTTSGESNLTVDVEINYP